MDFNQTVNQDPDREVTIVEEGPEVLPAAKGPVLTLAAIRPAFVDYLVVVDARIKTAQEIQVVDDGSCNLAAALVGEAKKAIKDMDNVKKNLPAYKIARLFIDQVNGLEKGLRDKFEIVAKTADQKVVRYRAKIENDRRIAEARAKKEAEDLQKKLDDEAAAENKRIADEAAGRALANAEAAGATEEEKVAIADIAKELAKEDFIEAAQVDKQIMPETDNVIRTETGTSAFSKRPWVFEIQDPDLVPREYLMIDEKKIKNAVKMGAREIPGVRIYQDFKMNYRT